MWFEELMGFREASPHQVRDNLGVDGETLISRVSGKRLTCGRLETPSLTELRERVRSASNDGALYIREVVADVKTLHADKSLAGSLFQVASQFNLFEMTSPSKTPEHGVGIYEYDPTQGPACAISESAPVIRTRNSAGRAARGTQSPG